MTPDKRLNQLEPVVADTAQKVDRLIETNGQILDVAVRADANAGLAAKGVANLTVDMNRRFDTLQHQVDNFQHGVRQQVDNFQHEVRQQVGNFRSEVQQQVGDFQREVQQQVGGFQYEVRQQVSDFQHEVQGGFNDVDQKIDNQIGGLRQEMNQRFDQLVTLIQERLK